MIQDGISKKGKALRSFLMVGQSNMSGRGELCDVEPIENGNCFMLRMGRWQPMSEPVNPDRDIFRIEFHSGISLAASFADAVAKFWEGDVGLIPCADGGTAIREWQPGEVLFDHAVMMTKLAKRTSDFAGIIWHQGESDCKDFDEAAYKAALLRTVQGLRTALGAEDLPFIMGELSEDIDAKWGFGDDVQKMNAFLNKVQEEIPYCAVASAKGLALKPDGIHFNAAACREFGIRYFEKYKEIINR